MRHYYFTQNHSTMDIKESYAKKSLADHDEHSEFQSSATSTAQTTKKDALDFTKTDAPTSRPCAVIAPGVQSKQQLNSQAEAWNEQAAYYKSHTSSVTAEQTFPSRNISPRQTFQENMPRIMLPPRIETLKPAIDPYSSGYIKQTSKYCEVPYLMNTNLSDHRKDLYMVPETLPPRGYPHYPPTYHTPQVRLDYPCSLSSAQCNKTTSSKPEDIPQAYKDLQYYRGANIRFEPYPALKEKYPRYDFSNIPHPYSAHAYSLPPNMKQVNHHPYINYDTSHRYLDPKLADTNKDYSKSATGEVPYVYNANGKYGPSHSRTPYYSRLSYPTETDPRGVGRPPFLQNRNNLDYDRLRDCPYPSVYHNIKGRLPPNYPVINSMNRTQNNIRSNKSGETEYLPSKNIDRYHNMYNPLANIPTQFSPNVISPSDSIESEGALNSSSHEDSGYLSQCSTASSKSLDNQRHFSYNYQIGSYGSHQSLGRSYTQKCEKSKLGKDKLNLRSYIENWDEGFEETSEDQAKTQTQIAQNPAEPQLVVLDAINIPKEELAKYQHIQRINKLPDNIRGFDNNELLNQFEKAIGSSESKEKDLMTFKLNPVEVNKKLKPLMTPSSPINRSTSPLDFEAKISQSVIRKELKFNFEIRPCTPSQINTASMQAQHMHMLSNMDYEKKTLHQNQNNVYKQMHSNQMIPHISPANTHHPLNKTCNSKIPKLSPINVNPSSLNENCGTVSNICFASLPTLDIELNIPEINQQYENQNYGTVITNINNQHNKNEIFNHLTPSTLHTENLIAKVDLHQNFNTLTTVLSPASSSDFASEKISTSKLSKFRIHKNSAVGCKETSSLSPKLASSSIPQRVDSVIIKPCDKSPTTNDGASLFIQKNTAPPHSVKPNVAISEKRFGEISINEAINLSLHSNELDDITNFNNKQLNSDSNSLPKTSEREKYTDQQPINSDGKVLENNDLIDNEAERTMNIVEDGLKKIFELTNEENIAFDKSNSCLDLSTCSSHTNSPISVLLTQSQRSETVENSACDNRVDEISESDSAPIAENKHDTEYSVQSSSFAKNCDTVEAINDDMLAAKPTIMSCNEDNRCHKSKVSNENKTTDISSSDSDSSSESTSSSGSEYSQIDSPKHKIDLFENKDLHAKKDFIDAVEKPPILANSCLHISENNAYLNVTFPAKSDQKIALKSEMLSENTPQNNYDEFDDNPSNKKLKNGDNIDPSKTNENSQIHEPNIKATKNHIDLGVFKLDGIVERNDTISINRKYKDGNNEPYQGALKNTEYDNLAATMYYAYDTESCHKKDSQNFESNTDSFKIKQKLAVGVNMKVSPSNVEKHPKFKTDVNVDIFETTTSSYKDHLKIVSEPDKLEKKMRSVATIGVEMEIAPPKAEKYLKMKTDANIDLLKTETSSYQDNLKSVAALNKFENKEKPVSPYDIEMKIPHSNVEKYHKMKPDANIDLLQSDTSSYKDQLKIVAELDKFEDKEKLVSPCDVEMKIPPSNVEKYHKMKPDANIDLLKSETFSYKDQLKMVTELDKVEDEEKMVSLYDIEMKIPNSNVEKYHKMKHDANIDLLKSETSSYKDQLKIVAELDKFEDEEKLVSPCDVEMKIPPSNVAKYHKMKPDANIDLLKSETSSYKDQLKIVPELDKVKDEEKLVSQCDVEMKIPPSNVEKYLVINTDADIDILKTETSLNKDNLKLVAESDKFEEKEKSVSSSDAALTLPPSNIEKYPQIRIDAKTDVLKMETSYNKHHLEKVAEPDTFEEKKKPVSPGYVEIKIPPSNVEKYLEINTDANIDLLKKETSNEVYLKLVAEPDKFEAAEKPVSPSDTVLKLPPSDTEKYPQIRSDTKADLLKIETSSNKDHFKKVAEPDTFEEKEKLVSLGDVGIKVPCSNAEKYLEINTDANLDFLKKATSNEDNLKLVAQQNKFKENEKPVSPGDVEIEIPHSNIEKYLKIKTDANIDHLNTETSSNKDYFKVVAEPDTFTKKVEPVSPGDVDNAIFPSNVQDYTKVKSDASTDLLKTEASSTKDDLNMFAEPNKFEEKEELVAPGEVEIEIHSSNVEKYLEIKTDVNFVLLKKETSSIKNHLKMVVEPDDFEEKPVSPGDVEMKIPPLKGDKYIETKSDSNLDLLKTVNSNEEHLKMVAEQDKLKEIEEPVTPGEVTPSEVKISSSNIDKYPEIKTYANTDLLETETSSNEDNLKMVAVPNKYKENEEPVSPGDAEIEIPPSNVEKYRTTKIDANTDFFEAETLSNKDNFKIIAEPDKSEVKEELFSQYKENKTEIENLESQSECLLISETHKPDLFIDRDYILPGNAYQVNGNMQKNVKSDSVKNDLQKGLNFDIQAISQSNIERENFISTKQDMVVSFSSDSESATVEKYEIHSLDIKKDVNSDFLSGVDTNPQNPVQANLKSETCNPKSLKSCELDTRLFTETIPSFQIDTTLSSKIKESDEVDAKSVSVYFSNSGDADGSKTAETEKFSCSSNEANINSIPISENLDNTVENKTDASVSLAKSKENHAPCEESDFGTDLEGRLEIIHSNSNHVSCNIKEPHKPKVDIVSTRKESLCEPSKYKSKFKFSNDKQCLSSNVESISLLADDTSKDEIAMQTLQENEVEKDADLHEVSKKKSDQGKTSYGSLKKEIFSASQSSVNSLQLPIIQKDQKEENFDNSSIGQPNSESTASHLSLGSEYKSASYVENSSISKATAQISSECVTEPIISIKTDAPCYLKRCSIVAYSESSESEDENENTKMTLNSAKTENILTPNDDNLQHCVTNILTKLGDQLELNKEPEDNGLDSGKDDEFYTKKKVESDNLQIQADSVCFNLSPTKLQNINDSTSAFNVKKDDESTVTFTEFGNNYGKKNVSKNLRSLKRSKSHDSFLEKEFKDKIYRQTGSKSDIECFSGSKKRKIKRNMVENISEDFPKVYLTTSNCDENVYMEADSTQSGYEILEGEICKPQSAELFLADKDVTFNNESPLEPIIESDENFIPFEEVCQDQSVVLHNTENSLENISYLPSEESENLQEYVIEDTNDIWLDNVACVETVVSENTVELEEQDSNFVEQYANEMQSDFQNFRELCSSHNNINALETLFRSPGTDMSSKLVSELLESFEEEVNGRFNLQNQEDNCQVDQHEDDSSDPMSGYETEVHSDSQGESCKLFRAKTVESSEGPPKTLITKAAQKYIPPLKVKHKSIPVKIPLSREKLKHYRLIKDIKANRRHGLPEIKITSVNQVQQEQCSVKDNITPKKIKPNFEDVLLTIDRTMKVNLLTKHKVRRKSIPKMLIKKTENGSLYSTTIPKPVSSPDLTGNKWQPWVCLKRDEFIEKMVAKNKTRAIFCPRTHRFAILHPKIVPRIIKKTVEEYYKEKNASSLKYTIKLNNNSNTNRRNFPLMIKENYTNR